MSRQLLQRLRRPASAHDRILQTGTMKSCSASAPLAQIWGCG